MKRPLTPKIPCPSCGAGLVPLPDELRETYRHVARKGSLSASGLLRLVEANVGTTAMNQRLERLRALDLLERTRIGHEWVYTIKPKTNDE